MAKRILITSTDLMMVQFLVPHVINLSKNGYEVEIACSDVGGRMDEIRSKLDEYVHFIYEVRLVRSPFSLSNAKGYKDLKYIIDNNQFDIIWTNEPVMGVVTRLASRNARSTGTKVIYMTHGFHFQKGGSLKYWLAFYPIEYIMSSFCDEIVTINKEDYTRAKQMKAGKVSYVHGIGVDTKRLQPSEMQNDIRDELGLDKNSFIVLSVGELNTNKNHKVIIDAISQLKDPAIHYLVCGKGDQREKLLSRARELKIENQVHLLGYRTDVVNICSQADLFAFPSYREGLGLAPLEAMYCALPLVTSNRRGPQDFMENGKSGFMCKPDDAGRFAKAIKILKEKTQLRKKCAERNKQAVKPYLLENVQKEILDVLSVNKDDEFEKLSGVSPKISVIMGIYNCAETLPDAIDSIINQTVDDWELILCDDGSTDDTHKVALEYQAKMPDRILVLKNKENKGLNYTLNHCLQYARGEFIARMDGDDVCVPDRFYKELRVFEEEPELSIVSSDMNFFDETGTWGLVKHPDYPTKEIFVRESPFCHAPCMIRKDAFDTVGGYSDAKILLRVEDYHLWYKLYHAGFKGKNIHEPLYSMRDDRNAYSRRKFKYRFNECYVKLLIIKDFKLPLINLVYVARPIIVGLLPAPVYNMLHKKRLHQ